MCLIYSTKLLQVLFSVSAGVSFDTDIRLQCCFVFKAKDFSLESVILLDFAKVAIDDTLGNLEITDRFLDGRLFKAKFSSLASAVLLLKILDLDEGKGLVVVNATD